MLPPSLCTPSPSRIIFEHFGYREVILLAILALIVVPAGLGQISEEVLPKDSSSQLAVAHSEQIAQVLGISGAVDKLREIQTGRSCGSTATIEELSLRQDLSETVLSTSLDVDGVIAEIDNERAQLIELRASLQGRRDHAINLMNVANLITGTGLGIAVNAMQFSSSTANLGNGLGVGSGIASTVLSIIGIKKQGGPQSTVGRIPNMLAPLFERPSALSSYYPPSVLAYLRSVPPGADAAPGTRLENLRAEWQKEGRLGLEGSPATEPKLTRLTASENESVKLTIDDLTDRISMLTDVSGRVALMKRDLAALMFSLRAVRHCPLH